MRVLVIDDDFMTTEWATIFLESENIETKTANSVTTAIECLGRWQPDVIVSDVSLKGDEDVFQLLDHLAADERTKKIPIIAVTGYALLDSEKEKFHAYLIKPFEAKALLKLIRGFEEQLQSVTSDK